jgi:hypothetical protein
MRTILILSSLDFAPTNASAGILLKNTRLVIPITLQERAPNSVYIGHQRNEKNEKPATRKDLVPKYG